MGAPTLTLLRGIPGSGKSTLASMLRLNWASQGFVSSHYEADQYFMENGVYVFDRQKLRQAHSWCQQSTIDALARGEHVIVSNTFTTLKELKPYFEMIHAYGKQPTVLVCQTNWGNVHGVPDDVLEAMIDRFQYDISSLLEQLPD
jgi:predicted kinase